MIRLSLTPLKEELELDVEGDIRSFTLREHTPKKGMQFLRKFDLLRQDVARVESLDLLDVGPEQWETVATGSDEVLLWLLDRPLDDAKPATLEWIKGFTLSQRQGVLDAQSRLNSLEEIAPNFLAILRLLYAARMAMAMLGDGATNGSGGKSQPDLGQYMDLLRDASSPSGLCESVSSTGASPSVSDGATSPAVS